MPPAIDQRTGRYGIGPAVEWTAGLAHEDGKWQPRATMLLVLATCGSFWALAIWTAGHWLR